MKKQEPKKFDFAKGKVSEVDAGELLRYRQAVRDEVVKPIREREAEMSMLSSKSYRLPDITRSNVSWSKLEPLGTKDRVSDTAIRLV